MVIEVSQFSYLFIGWKLTAEPFGKSWKIKDQTGKFEPRSQNGKGLKSGFFKTVSNYMIT